MRAISISEGIKLPAEMDLSKYWCWNKDCPDHGKIGQGNIVFKERYGKQNRTLLRCKTCNHCFSETRGTAFFHLDTSQDEVLRTLAMIPEKGGIRATARATGHDKNAICRWINIAGAHCREVTDYFLHDLNLTRVQVDEIWSYIKKGKKRDRE
jgi:transposase-like protein